LIFLSDVRKDRTKYDTGRKRSGKRLAPDTNMHRPILAIDGEGVTDKDGHRYIMLAASNGSYVSATALTTEQCFEYLLELPSRHLIVGFSINYDVAKWFANIPKEKLREIWQTGMGWYGKYRIRYAPGKQITISDGKRRVHIYDVFGYYQKSFVTALEEWKVGESSQVERIKAMKASRSEFTDEGFDEMLAYCREECELLVQLVEKLRQALIEGNIPMRQWYGAGAIAAAIMEKEGVKQHVTRQPPESAKLPILCAYFGGRFELFKSGEHRDVHLYDIRSAYPYIASTLPCQSHLIYRHVDGWEETPFSLHYCSWDLPRRTPWPPFPFRDAKSRQIVYPYKGEGWYHNAEVMAAMRLFPGQIFVTKTLAITSHCPRDCKGSPFGFIPDYFAYRNALKARGSQAQLTIKLGLNSVYGKTAQGVGYGDKKPPFQSYLYAGMITAGTRAMILDAIRQSPESVLWIATDGIASTVPLNLDIGDELGEWEYKNAEWVFCVQPGVYQVSENGTVSIRTRGFGKAETDFDAIKRNYYANPIWGKHTYSTWRFIGLGSALMRKDFWGAFGQWRYMDREVSFFPSKRYPEMVLRASEDGLTVRDMQHMTDTPPITYWPPSGVAGQSSSAEYEPKKTWVDQWEREGDEALELLLDNETP
jgi:hypothetical protein